MAAKQKITTPKSVQVSGLTWKVRIKTNLRSRGEALDGLCIPDKQEIHLNRGILAHVDRTRKTLIHEALHAALLSHPQYYDETLIAVIEDRVDELIRINPETMRMYGYERCD